MDVPVITEEIGRLQNSLVHLKRTQDELQMAAKADPDPEFIKAIEENELVIGSQQERVAILKMALTERGILMGSHYDVASLPPNEPSRTITQTSSETIAGGRPDDFQSGETVDEHGVYL